MANCLCVRRMTVRAQLARIPPCFGRPRLSRLRPRPDLHPTQAKAIAFIKARPLESYLLVGKNGTGKTHLAWCLYRNALLLRRAPVACRIRDLIDDFRRIEVSSDREAYLPRVTARDLERARKPWFLFFDEFEKARPTEFAAEMLFNLLDAVKNFNHQLVVCSNFTEVQLRDHWGRVEPVYGNSIMTRLEYCNTVRFF